MCYDKQSRTRPLNYYVNYYDASQTTLDYEAWTPQWHESGFAHLPGPVITNQEPQKIQMFTWGLIPFWVKDPLSAVKLSNTTLNARGETIFEKPAFRGSAKEKRCIVLVDAFYEHYHLNGKTYPFFIRLKSREPMAMAGLWDQWKDKTNGIEKFTYSIVTTKANRLLEKIHNNPKLEERGPRMPVILLKGKEREWLQDLNGASDKQALEEMMQPYPDNEIEAWPVGQLRGKNGVGNSEKAIEPKPYPELEGLFAV